MLDFLGHYASWGPVFLRLGAGITVAVHGYPKLFGPQPGPKGFAQYLKSLGFAGPETMAYVVAVAEFVGGICLILGFLTRLAARVSAIELLAIVLAVKSSKGFLMSGGGWAWDCALLNMASPLLVHGPAPISL